MILRKLFFCILLFSGPLAWSQAQHEKESAPSRGDFYGGASFTGSNPSNATLGAGGGVDLRAYRWLGIAGEFSAYVGTSGSDNTTTLFDYLAGPRVSAPAASRLAPFADFLVGGQSMNNSSSQHTYYYGNGSSIAMAGDAGVDIRLPWRLALRSQGGFVFSKFHAGAGQVGNYRWRAAANLVYRF